MDTHALFVFSLKTKKMRVVVQSCQNVLPWLIGFKHAAERMVEAAGDIRDVVGERVAEERAVWGEEADDAGEWALRTRGAAARFWREVARTAVTDQTRVGDAARAFGRAGRAAGEAVDRVGDTARSAADAVSSLRDAVSESASRVRGRGRIEKTEDDEDSK